MGDKMESRNDLSNEDRNQKMNLKSKSKKSEFVSEDKEIA